MKTVKVRLGKKSYNIYIGKGIIRNIAAFLNIKNPGTPLFVVTNRSVNALHGGKLKKALKALSGKILFYKVPDSEKSKSFPVYIRTMRALARFARKTKPVVFAFGGGVIGDLAGFVASAYRRGVPYVQVPTTILAQVDSSVGGKVAIDIEEAKNIVGNFYQPKMVICDLAFLKTLPEKELRTGLVEVVKYGIIKDKNFFVFLEKNSKKLLKRDYKTLERLIYDSCLIKARIVEKDEFDTKGIRAILNFGHTIGHAIEAALRYSKSITHGKAVAAGMLMANSISLRLGMLKRKDYERMRLLINAVAPRISTRSLKSKDILTAISYDKKFVYGTNRFVLAEKIGHVKVVDDVPLRLIKEVVEAG